MLTSTFVLALAVLDAATVSASPYQCKPKQLGKYFPLATNHATLKYCTAFLRGNAPRQLEEHLEERSGKNTIECLQSDLKKERKSYQSAICSCIGLPKPTTSKSTTKCTTTTKATTKSSTKCTTSTRSVSTTVRGTGTTSISTTRRSSTSITPSTTSTSTGTSSTMTTISSTTSSAASTPTCTEAEELQGSKPGGCVYSQFCDTLISGTSIGASTVQPNQRSCLNLCDAGNSFLAVPCEGYSWDFNTGVCQIFSELSDYTPKTGAFSASVFRCPSPPETPSSSSSSTTTTATTSQMTTSSSTTISATTTTATTTYTSAAPPAPTCTENAIYRGSNGGCNYQEHCDQGISGNLLTEGSQPDITSCRNQCDASNNPSVLTCTAYTWDSATKNCQIYFAGNSLLSAAGLQSGQFVDCPA